MSLPAHTTKVGDYVRICKPDFYLPGFAPSEPTTITAEALLVVDITPYDIVVQEKSGWKWPVRSWVKVRQ